MVSAKQLQIRQLVFDNVLQQLIAHDTDYHARYPLVFQAVSLALGLGMAAGVRLDPREPDWPVVYIDLPTGQVSWHMPAYVPLWDGHTTDEKHRRIREFLVRPVQASDAQAR